MYQRTKNRLKAVTDTVKEYIKINDIIMIFAGILSGRTFLLYNLSPFGIACTWNFIKRKYSSVSCLLPMLGVISTGKGQEVLKYLIVYFFMGIVAFFSDRLKNERIINFFFLCFIKER